MPDPEPEMGLKAVLPSALRSLAPSLARAFDGWSVDAGTARE